MTDELDAAKSTIDVTIYLLTDQSVIHALADADRRGVQVRVIMIQSLRGLRQSRTDGR